MYVHLEIPSVKGIKQTPCYVTVHLVTKQSTELLMSLHRHIQSFLLLSNV
jgi:hypothetical protein